MIPEGIDNPWYLFEIELTPLLTFLERKMGSTLPPHPGLKMEANRWHTALREGLNAHLHINLGFPGLEDVAQPIVENASSLHAALLLGRKRIKVIVSGEWERAVQEGLISKVQLAQHEQALGEFIKSEEADQAPCK